ncbi:MAG: hypothetical protein ABW110_05505, partial [Steroidobacteraceae bacterium]
MNFEEFMVEQDNLRAVDRQGLLRASSVNPDEAGDAQRLAPAVGLPTPLVQRNLPEIRKQQEMRSFEDFLLNTPELSGLSSNDDFLSVAQDQAAEMGAFKQTMVNLRASTNRMTGGLLTATAAGLRGMEQRFRLPVGFGRDEAGQWGLLTGEQLAASRERTMSPLNTLERIGSGIQESARREQAPLVPWEEVTSAEGVIPTAAAGAAFV